MSKKRTVKRFGVRSEDGRHSSIWSIWADHPSRGGKAKNDVYLSSRTLAGTLKVSLHQSGDWRIAFTSEYAKSQIESGIWPEQARRLDQWQRPAFKNNGILKALSILVPSSDLEDYPQNISNSKPVSWITTSAVGTTIEFWVIFSKVAYELGNWPYKSKLGTKCLDSFPLANGEIVWIVYGDINTGKHLMENIRMWKNQVRDSNKDKDLAHKKGLRLMMLGTADDGTRLLVEVSPRY